MTSSDALVAVDTSGGIIFDPGVSQVVNLMKFDYECCLLQESW